MEKTSKLTTKKVILILVAVFLVCGCALGGLVWARNRVNRVAADEEYTYINPDETKAETDEGFKIDGVLDEEQYQKNNWLYLHNTDDYADVDIAMTSYYGEKGMYFVYDVTERNPIYVNLERSTTANSGIEMYLAPNNVTTMKTEHLFEIDLLPTGHMSFKKTNGKGGFTKVASADDIMAYLGATTKGGEVNTEECTGYCLELFIPWEYMENFGIDSEEMKNGYAYSTPAHITSLNYEGTDLNSDRYWYFFGEQHGAELDTVYQYFRFNKDGVIGTVPSKIVEGENYSVTGDPVVVPGMKTTYVISPKEGYAINSILVNAKEHIQDVAYSEDGDALLTVRGKKEGLEIAATTEAVADGNKTLYGTVEVEGDSLSGTSVSYMSKNGKKKIEIDGNGKFVLPDMKQGYYKITVEKEGYEKLVQGVYLNRDVTQNFVLEDDAFTVVSGKSWITDEQEDGLLYKFGGRGIMLSEDSYNQFTAEINLKYDEELSKEYDHTYFTHQRQGIRIKFSNEKYWFVDVLVENGQYRVQYAAHSSDNSIFTSWKSIYLLSEKEIAMYTGEEGIKLEVQRDGKYGNVYINDKLVAVEMFDDEFAKCTAQVGFESWVANRVVEEYQYRIISKAESIVKDTIFSASGKWDISTQYDGYISMPDGGNGNIDFAHKYADMDLTLRVRDYQNSTDKEGVWPRTDVLFVFDNGAHISFGVTTISKGKYVAIQSMNQGADDGKQIYNRWKDWGHLKDDEKAQYLAEGVDFRIVRYGTDVLLYIGDRLVKTADLTNNNSGVTADMQAKVTIRHYDDAGVEVVLPFKVKTEVDNVTITSVEDKNGKVVGKRNLYLLGDEVTLFGEGKEGYYCKAMKVNGKEVSMNYDGTYTFIATERNYTVEGTFVKQTFVYNNKWNLLKQDEGIVSLPNGGNGDKLQFYNSYTDIDLTVKVKDYEDPNNQKPRTDVLFVFENGAHISFGINTWSKTQVVVQTLNNAEDDGKQILNRYTKLAQLNSDEVKEYFGDGVDFRVVRQGTDVLLYIGDRFVKVTDLTSNNSGVTANMKADVYLRHYDDKDVEVVLPFELSTQVETVAITSVEGENGKIVAAREKYLVGDSITLSGKGKEGYYCTSMKVNGEAVSMNYDGTYTFTATEKNYTLEGTFEKQTFVYNNKWNLLKQNEGVVSLPNGGNGGKLQFYKQYANIDVTVGVRDYADPGNQKPRTDVLFVFENGAHISFGLNTWSPSQVVIQTLNNAEDDGKQILSRYTKLEQLRSDEVADYFDAGVDFRVVRYGTDVYLYIGDRLAKVVDLTSNADYKVTADMKADVYIRHYEDEGVQVDIPFEVSDVVDKVDGTVSIVQDNSTSSAIVFANTITDMDLTMKVKLNNADNKFSEKTDVLFEFANGKNISFHIIRKDSAYRIMNLNLYSDANDTNNTRIYNRDSRWGVLNTDEEALFTSTGVDFRIVRAGTNILLYIGERYVTTVDLTNNGTSGVEADTAAKVTIRYYGKQNEQMDVPFEMTTTFETGTINSVEGEHGKVTAGRELYVIGDTITLSGEGNDGYYCTSMKVNGKNVSMRHDGTYTFTATEKSYTVEGTFSNQIFVDNSNWNLLKQNEGVVSLPNGGNGGKLQFRKQYTNIDLTIGARGVATSGDDKGRTDILFVFENGAHVSFGLNTWSATQVVLETLNNAADDGKQIINRYTNINSVKLNTDEVADYFDAGIDFRVVRYGTDMYIYVGERLLYVADLTSNANYKVTADMKADVYIRHYGDSDAQMDIPFEVSDTVNKVDGTASILLNNTTSSKLVFANSITNMDLTMKVKLNNANNKFVEKTDVLFEFANGKNISFHIIRKDSAYRIMNLNLYSDANDTNNTRIYNRDSRWGVLNSDEEALFTSTGVDFRVVRDGTNIKLYLGERLVNTVDLTGNNSGVTASTAAKVTIRYYGISGECADVPFEMKKD